MTKAAVRMLAVALVSQIGYVPCFAQTDNWERIKLIEPGKAVRIKLHSGKSVKGKMQAWTPEKLTVSRGNNKSTDVAKSDVAQVGLVAGMSRGRRAAWAGIIGAAAGAAIFGGMCAYGNDCFISPAAVAAGSALWVGGISAGIAALIPQHTEVIYTATR